MRTRPPCCTPDVASGVKRDYFIRRRSDGRIEPRQKSVTHHDSIAHHEPVTGGEERLGPRHITCPITATS